MQQSSAAQLAANRANAQKSTGPKTDDGKAASAQNNFRHGLAFGLFQVQPWEDASHYEVMLESLIREHRPDTVTEEILVGRMAQHNFLRLRAIALQEGCFPRDSSGTINEKSLALYLRYQTAHERAFRQCLHDLLKLRAERQKVKSGFEWQKQKAEQHAYRKMVAEAETDLKMTRSQCLKSADRRAQEAAATPETGFAAPKAA